MSGVANRKRDEGQVCDPQQKKDVWLAYAPAEKNPDADNQRRGSYSELADLTPKAQAPCHRLPMSALPLASFLGWP